MRGAPFQNVRATGTISEFSQLRARRGDGERHYGLLVTVGDELVSAHNTEGAIMHVMPKNP